MPTSPHLIPLFSAMLADALASRSPNVSFVEFGKPDLCQRRTHHLVRQPGLPRVRKMRASNLSKESTIFKNGLGATVEVVWVILTRTSPIL